ncbi:hypothetical protein [Amycolatopsis sp. lyj-108]|uniref:hypothetical protein n=1 Tax=Amycolatopsis sp. lyj-108 TaxID=2789286 RepID=UPI00397C94A1
MAELLEVELDAWIQPAVLDLRDAPVHRIDQFSVELLHGTPFAAMYSVIVTIAGITAMLVAATVTTASAAPGGFTAAAVHGGGTGATATSATGAMGWSTSLKTVTLTNVRFFVKGGECAYLLIAGYQGGTVVTDPYRYPASGSVCPAVNHTYSLGTITETSGPPGGVQELGVFVTDVRDVITGYAECYQTASACIRGQY